MTELRNSYPDISDILAQKARRRTALSKLSFAEKIAMVEEMRERFAPLRRQRRKRLAEGRGTVVKAD